METLVFLSVLAFGLGLLFWLAVPWFDPLLTLVVKSKLEFTGFLQPYLVELHTIGSIRRKYVSEFIEFYFLTSIVHALLYCIFMLAMPLSVPFLIIYLLVKRILKNKIRD